MTWIEKELQIYESAGTVEVENRILLRLFEMWKSVTADEIQNEHFFLFAVSHAERLQYWKQYSIL